MKGSIVQRGDSFSICYYLGKDHEGKWVQKWESGFKRKEDAEIALALRNQKLSLFCSGNISHATVAEFLNYWYEVCCEPNLADNTLKGYRRNINKHIIPYIGEICVLRLSPYHIHNLYLQLKEEGLSNTSIRYVHNNLHRALEFAVQMNMILINPSDSTRPPKVNQYEAVFLRQEQVKKLLSGTADSDIYFPILLGVCLGLRRGEVLGLRWQDIDFEQKMIHIHCSAQAYSHGTYSFQKTKSKASRRTLLMSDTVASILQARKQVHKQKRRELGSTYNTLNLVCFRETGIPYTASTMQHQFKKAVHELGLPDIRFHDLRHTCATILLRNGIPAKIVSSLMGHSSIQVTMDIYSHVVPEMQDTAAMTMDHLLSQV